MRQLLKYMAVVALGLSTPAFAQYYINLDIAPSGPATCTTTTASQFGAGSISAFLPTDGDNYSTVIKVNGVVIAATADHQDGPFPYALAIPGIGVILPAQTLPYTFEEITSPYTAGHNIGTGVRIFGTCNADGSATFNITNGFVAPNTAAAPVPTLAPAWLAFVAALLAMGGIVAVGRRPSRGR